SEETTVAFPTTQESDRRLLFRIGTRRETKGRAAFVLDEERRAARVKGAERLATCRERLSELDTALASLHGGLRRLPILRARRWLEAVEAPEIAQEHHAEPACVPRCLAAENGVAELDPRAVDGGRLGFGSARFRARR